MRILTTLFLIFFINSASSQVNIPESEKEMVLLNHCWNVTLSKSPNKSVYLITWDYALFAEAKISFYASKKDLEDLKRFLKNKLKQNDPTVFRLGNNNISVKRRNWSEIILEFDGEDHVLTAEEIDCLFKFDRDPDAVQKSYKKFFDEIDN